MKKVPLLAALVLSAASIASAQTIAVSGTGKVMLTPDRVTFTVGVETQSKTVEEAVAENSRKTAAVIAALKKAGAKPEEIRTTNFSIYPQQQYTEGQRPRIIGYQASNNVTVTRSETSDAGRLLQAAVGAGVNTASGLSMVVSDRSRGRSEGLRLAYEDARAKADVLARAAGKSVGSALTISEGGSVNPPVRPLGGPEMAMASMKSADVPIEEGTDELTFLISVVFDLE